MQNTTATAVAEPTKVKTTIQNGTLQNLYNRVLANAKIREDYTITNNNFEFQGANLSASFKGGISNLYDLSDTFIEQAAAKWKIPVKYAKRMHATTPQLFADNFNTWKSRDPEARRMLLRTYADRDNDFFKARALVSDRYLMIDNIDLIAEVLEVVQTVMKERGIKIQPVKSCLTENNIFIRFVCPEIENHAAAMKHYHDPETGKQDSRIFSGFIIKNSEVGKGSLMIAPRVMVGACHNGLIFTREGFRQIHLGRKLEDTNITWSNRTQYINLDLIKSQVGDALNKFCSDDFLGKQVDMIEAAATHKLENPIPAMVNAAKHVGLADERVQRCLKWFANQGGSSTTWDVMQALTYEAKSLKGEERFDIESKTAELPTVIDSLDQKLKKTEDIIKRIS